MDQQRIQPYLEANHLQQLAHRYQELVKFGEQRLADWRNECDAINARLANNKGVTFVESANPNSKDSDDSFLHEQLQDATEDLRLSKLQLEQIQEELEFYFYRYRDKERECHEKAVEINKLAQQQAWLVDQITKQSTLLTRMMQVLARLNAQ